MEAAQQGEVAVVAAVMITGGVGAFAVADVAGCLFPLPPVIDMVAAFHLVGCGRGAPQKIGGERPSSHQLERRESTAMVVASAASASSRRPSVAIGPSTATVAWSELT